MCNGHVYTRSTLRCKISTCISGRLMQDWGRLDGGEKKCAKACIGRCRLVHKLPKTKTAEDGGEKKCAKACIWRCRLVHNCRNENCGGKRRGCKTKCSMFFKVHQQSIVIVIVINSRYSHLLKS